MNACVGGKTQSCDPLAGAGIEICNGLDDDCDGQTDITAAGVHVCDANCPASKAYAPPANGTDFTTINMTDFAKNNIDTYQCGTQAKAVPVKFSANEALLVPYCPAGQHFSAQTNTSGVFMALLHGDCNVTSGTSVTPAKCTAFGTNSVSGGIVGQDYVVVDATANKSFGIKFTCTP